MLSLIAFLGSLRLHNIEQGIIVTEIPSVYLAVLC